MSQELVEILERQREKFIARFGREAGPDDPISFVVPSDDEYDAAVTKAMEQAGVAPAVIYAFRRTGRIITKENAKFVPAAALEAWQARDRRVRDADGGPETELQ
jgi:hypothetical protein